MPGALGQNSNGVELARDLRWEALNFWVFICNSHVLMDSIYELSSQTVNITHYLVMKIEFFKTAWTVKGHLDSLFVTGRSFLVTDRSWIILSLILPDLDLKGQTASYLFMKVNPLIVQIPNALRASIIERRIDSVIECKVWRYKVSTPNSSSSVQDCL